MHRFIATTTLSLLTVGSSFLGIASPVNASASTQPIEAIITETTFPPTPSQVLDPTREIQVADIGYACETYYDGSWACCAVDSYGNWYCEYGY